MFSSMSFGSLHFPSLTPSSTQPVDYRISRNRLLVIMYRDQVDVLNIFMITTIRILQQVRIWKLAMSPRDGSNQNRTYTLQSSALK
jgi:hypothetical protein